VLAFELRALSLLDMPLVLSALAIFLLWSHIYARANLDQDPPTYTSCVAGRTDVHHRTTPTFFTG
jgi:hypothetical protein